MAASAGKSAADLFPGRAFDRCAMCQASEGLSVIVVLRGLASIAAFLFLLAESSVGLRADDSERWGLRFLLHGDVLPENPGPCLEGT